MGGVVSSLFPSSAPSSSSLLQPFDPRPRVNYSQLHFLDLVLIRSAIPVNGFQLDTRIAQHIRHSITGEYVPETSYFAKFDRIGLIQLPSFSDSSEFDSENVEVIEATQFGIQSQSMKKVLENAIEVVVRPLFVLTAEEEKQKQRELDVLIQHKKRNQERQFQSEHLGTIPMEEEKDRMDGPLSLSSSSGLSIDTPILEKEQEIRLEFTQKYYQFSGPIINRSYQQCQEQLNDLLHYLGKQLGHLEDITPQEELAMNEIVEQYNRNNEGEIYFEDLLDLFNSISHDSRVRNPFTDADLYTLTAQFSDQAGKLFSNSGKLPVDIFVAEWRQALKKCMPIEKRLQEWLSGGFVSLALQTIGVLPVDYTAGHGEFFLPMDFAGYWIPKGSQVKPEEWTKLNRRRGSVTGHEPEEHKDSDSVASGQILRPPFRHGGELEYREGKAVERFVNARLGPEYIVGKVVGNQMVEMKAGK